MIAQVGDIILIGGKKRDLLGELPLASSAIVVIRDELFSSNTACMRGYIASVLFATCDMTMDRLCENTAMPSARVRSKKSMSSDICSSPRRAEEPAVVMIGLVSKILADGGMPGGSADERAAASLLVLLALSESPLRSVFVQHINRLLAFLKSGVLDQLDNKKKADAAMLVGDIEEGRPVAGRWATLLVEKKSQDASAPVSGLWDLLRMKKKRLSRANISRIWNELGQACLDVQVVGDGK